jgi:hypothetical protein
VQDLAKWDANFYSPTVGGQWLIDQLQTPGQLNDGTPLTYGFGLWRDTYHGQTRVWHTGAWAGYRALIMRFPDRHESIIIECNAADAHTYALARQLVDILIPDTVSSTAPVVETFTPPNAAGLYSSDAVGDILRVSSQDNAIVIEVGDAHRTLLPAGGYTLRDTTDGVTYEFGPDRVIVRSFDDVPDTMRRVAPPVDNAAAFAGRYTSAEIGVTWTVSARSNGSLVIHRPRGDDLTLTPLYRDGFMSDDGTPIHFLRDTAFTITTNGIHDLRFSRDRHVSVRAP